MARIHFQLLAILLVLIAITSGLFSSSKKIKKGNTYQLKQKVLTLGTSYTITDGRNKPVYKVNVFYLNFEKQDYCMNLVRWDLRD